MAVSPIMLNGIQNTPVLRSSEVREINQNIERIKQDYARFNSDYINKRNLLLECLNNILKVNGNPNTYSFANGDLPIETIFNENSLPDGICNAGKKAYAYYLKEVLQKLNLLNQHILKGQEALTALNECTNAAQIKNYETILELQDGLVKKYLDDFNKYTVVQTLITTRYTIRNTINNKPASIPPVTSTETNYDIRGKIWNEDGTATGNFDTALSSLDEINDLRKLTTKKETGFQTITTTLCNIRNYKDLVKQGTSKQIASYLTMTNLNDKFGFNVVDKKIEIIPPLDEEEQKKQTTPIALFDELTLLEKLKYIRVYYTQNTNPYHYPEDLKSGVPCMSRSDLEKHVYDANDNKSNTDELVTLGIIPSDTNKPKTDLVEPGAIELFYVGYLKDSMGAINALAAFMEVKSVSMLAQIEQQSYRIKALKTYLKMLEIALQELNTSYERNSISTSEGDKTYTKAYLAIKYAAANQTRTLATIKNKEGQMEDYIVLQVDGNAEAEDYKHYNLSDNQTYIYVKATTEGINEFLSLQWDAVDMLFKNLSTTSFNSLNVEQIKDGLSNGTEFGGGVDFNPQNRLNTHNYLYKTAQIYSSYTITGDTSKYGKYFDSDIDTYTTYFKPKTIKKSDIKSNQRMVKISEWEYVAPLGTHYDHFLITKVVKTSNQPLTSTNNNILFAKFDDNDQAIKELPKELETAKVSMTSILTDNYGGVGMSWKNKNDKYKNQWRTLVDQWQNICQTAIENIGSQIESVNKTIKSLRSKIDTFDSSASRFRDKFYSTTMTVLNKLS